MFKQTKMLQSSICVFAFATFMASAEPVKWDFSDEYGASPNEFTYQAVQHCLAEVNKSAGEDLQITYQGGGALGFKSADHFEAVSMGMVQSAITLQTQLSGVDSLFNLTSIPFIANSPEEAYQLWQAAKPEYAKVFAENGMILLWALPNAPSGIHSKHPITSLEALEGLRIRTYDKNSTDTLKKAGASPLQLAYSDLVPALSTGGVDAVLTSADGGKNLSVWDYGIKSFTEINYAMALFVVHVNRDAFEQLTPKAQSALMDNVDECDKFAWKVMEEGRVAPYPELESHGVTITTHEELPAEVLNALESAADQIKQDWLAATGEQGQHILDVFEAAKAKQIVQASK